MVTLRDSRAARNLSRKLPAWRFLRLSAQSMNTDACKNNHEDIRFCPTKIGNDRGLPNQKKGEPPFLHFKVY